MYKQPFPVIDLTATGANIRRLRLERGLTVRDLQRYFGFEQPQAIYKWQKGASLPTVDNLYALGTLFGVPMEQILIPMTSIHPYIEQQAGACCSHFFRKRPFRSFPEKCEVANMFALQTASCMSSLQRRWTELEAGLCPLELPCCSVTKVRRQPFGPVCSSFFLSVLRDTEGFDAAGSIFASVSGMSKRPGRLHQRDKYINTTNSADFPAGKMEMCDRVSEQSERGKCGIAQGRKRVCGSAFIPKKLPKEWTCLFRQRAAS